MPYNKITIPALLRERGTAFELLEHAPMHTMEDMDAAGLTVRGNVPKNLFLRDMKGKNHFLVTAMENKRVDLRALAETIGSTKLSFASAERLEKYLGLLPGSVSPFGILNDDSRSVQMIFDADLRGEERLGIHPNDNTATLFLRFADVEALIREHGNSIAFVHFESL